MFRNAAPNTEKSVRFARSGPVPFVAVCSGAPPHASQFPSPTRTVTGARPTPEEAAARGARSGAVELVFHDAREGGAADSER
jgi:hypothetical protein